MATPKTATALLTATGKNALKRVEVYLSNDTYETLAKEAAAQSRSTKNYIEVALNTQAYRIKNKK